jgi:hypothetical protein
MKTDFIDSVLGPGQTVAGIAAEIVRRKGGEDGSAVTDGGPRPPALPSVGINNLQLLDQRKEVNNMKRRPQIGEAVIFCDADGTDHPALVTTDWGLCCNVVLVSNDESKQDQYGRQIERHTSISDADRAGAHGMYWRFPDDARIPYKPPVAV